MRCLSIYLIFFILTSCSTNNDKGHEINRPLVDTTLTIQTTKQKIGLVVNDKGEVELLKIYRDTNSQVIFFHENGLISELTNRKNRTKGNSLYFDSTGQVYKIKTYAEKEATGGDQFIRFAPSKSKSLLIDHDKTHLPIVYGLRDTFKLNSPYTLSFNTFDRKGDEKYKIAIESLEYDSTKVKISLVKGSSDKIIISSQKGGTYRLVGRIGFYFYPKTTDKKALSYSISNMLDLDLTFD